MQERIKEFLIEKKGTIIFAVLLLLVFGTVIFVANRAINNARDGDAGVVAPGEDNDSGDQNQGDGEAPSPRVARPLLLNDFVVVRTFFDPEIECESGVGSTMDGGSVFTPSEGKSFGCSTREAFDVVSILPGTIIDIIPSTAFEGITVVIDHGENVVSKYMSLFSTAEGIAVGQFIEQGTVIGVAGTSSKDVEIGRHVHLQIHINESPVNPATVFGKTLNEISITK